VARQVDNHGLTPEQIRFTDEALAAIIRGYTREAGVRNLEREIGAICRKIARRQAEGQIARVEVTRVTVEEMLGAPRHLDEEMKDRTKDPGVAIGLAWTPVGGDVLFVEATAYPGDGKLTITGQLGDVMKESASAALSYLKANAWRWGKSVDPEWFRVHDLHVHVPAGAVPKDGPSAGITMATAMVSLVTGRPVRSDTAMTGEITLTGKVLPIGGLKEKALAAQRAGIERVVAPKLNEVDYDEFPPSLKDHMEFIWVEQIDQVLREALEVDRPKRRSKRSAERGDGRVPAAARRV